MNDTFLTSTKITIAEAMAKINEIGSGQPLVIFLLDENKKIAGSLTDGDVRRGLLSGVPMTAPAARIMNRNFKYVTDVYDFEKIAQIRALNIKLIPLVRKNREFVELIDLTKYRAILPIDAVIMAGGKGVRLKPYTNDVPKPMLKLGSKPIIAYTIDRLVQCGVKNFYIAVNHLKEQIISYVKKNYDGLNVSFIEEESQLGTIGALSLVGEFAHKDILVSNADILTNIDYSDFYLDYKKAKYDMSMATFNVRINVPYAILEEQSGAVKSFVEKPQFNYQSNAGIYFLNAAARKLIPHNEKFDATELFEKLLQKKRKLGCFPIRGYWLDVGNAQNYAKAQDDVRYINF